MYNPEDYFLELIELKKDFKAQQKAMLQKGKQCYINTPSFFNEIRSEQEVLANNQKKIHSEISNFEGEMNDDVDKSQSQFQIMDFFKTKEENTEKVVQQIQDLTKVVSEKL